jgi:sulfotransferase
MVEKIFFQSSLPRAGSTMLQNLMAQNPDFYVTPTSGVLELVFGAQGNYTNNPEFKAQDAELMRKAFLGFSKEGMKGYFEAITDKPYILDKSRGWGIHYPLLKMFIETPKIICMVRDLRDVFASMENNFRKNPDMAQTMINHAQGLNTTTAKRVATWSQGPPVGLAIERIFEMIRQAYDHKILFVKYEDLCLHPEVQMNRIYDYLELEHFEHDFDNIEQVTVEDDEVYGIGKLHEIRTKLELQPSKAREILGKDQCNQIFDAYQWFFHKFNYKK